jgi:hypothetical protein
VECGHEVAAINENEVPMFQSQLQSRALAQSFIILISGNNR